LRGAARPRRRAAQPRQGVRPALAGERGPVVRRWPAAGDARRRARRGGAALHRRVRAGDRRQLRPRPARSGAADRGRAGSRVTSGPWLLHGRSALSAARRARALARGRAVCPGLSSLTASWMHLVWTHGPITDDAAMQLTQMLDYGPIDEPRRVEGGGDPAGSAGGAG